MVKIKKFVFNPFQENTFVVWDDLTKECAIIDPGCSDELEENALSGFISSLELIPNYLINTHCHLDHIWGCKFVKEKYNLTFLIPEDDFILLKNAGTQAARYNVPFKEPPAPDDFISQNLKISLGKSEIKFLYTPGHTPGEFCLYFPDENFCIVGDVLFKDSIGRTDLWGGDYRTLMDSIRTKLLSLDDNVVIYPGHGDESTIGRERTKNPFLNE
ncbi:MAG TPA: MBL fold metallo-hydrolase [Ignavibacteriaceae bacterium]|nr:MBL fold metallo-hydrolase [Ignavibacteriaceae bacterium]